MRSIARAVAEAGLFVFLVAALKAALSTSRLGHSLFRAGPYFEAEGVPFWLSLSAGTALLMALRLRRRAWAQSFSRPPVRWRAGLWGGVVYLSVFGAAGQIGLLAGIEQPSALSGAGALVWIVLAPLAAALGETLRYQVGVQFGVDDKHAPEALVIAGVAFAVGHWSMGVPDVLARVPAGLVLALVARRGGTVLIPLGAHALYDAQLYAQGTLNSKPVEWVMLAAWLAVLVVARRGLLELAHELWALRTRRWRTLVACSVLGLALLGAELVGLGIGAAL